jgi:hypothetical protein
MFNYNEGRTMVLNIYTFILIFLCGTFVVGGLFFFKKVYSISHSVPSEITALA